MKRLVNLILRYLSKAAVLLIPCNIQPTLLLAAFILLLGSQPIFGQNSELTGKVVDYETGRVMPGVTIIGNLPGNGTVSDVDGNFKLKIKGDTRELELNFIGYYVLKFVNIPKENEPIDFGEIKLVKNHLSLKFFSDGVVYKLSESDKDKDKETRRNVVKKYRIGVCGNELKPYFEKNKLLFSFTVEKKLTTNHKSFLKEFKIFNLLLKFVKITKTCDKQWI